MESHPEKQYNGKNKAKGDDARLCVVGLWLLGIVKYCFGFLLAAFGVAEC